MKQLRVTAEHNEHDRDHAFHLCHNYEYTSGALEISIVLASVSVVTRIRGVGYAASGIGLLACIYGLGVFFGLV